MSKCPVEFYPVQRSSQKVCLSEKLLNVVQFPVGLNTAKQLTNLWETFLRYWGDVFHTRAVMTPARR